MFWHDLKIAPLQTPQNGPSKYKFLVWLKLGRQFYFSILTDTTDKYFDIVWGCPPPRKAPKTQIFARPNLRCLCFLNQKILQRQTFWQSLGVPPPLKNLSNRPLKHHFLQRLWLELYFLFDIMKYWKDKHFNIFWKCDPPEIPKWTSQKSIFGQFNLSLVVFDISRYLSEKKLT